MVETKMREWLNSSLQETSLRSFWATSFALVRIFDLDSANFKLPTHEANSSIVDEFLQLCEASDADRTNGSSRKRALCNCEKSPQDEFALDSAIRRI